MDKTEWPSTQRVESLRLRGYVPVSYTALRMAAAAVLLIFCFSQFDSLADAFLKLAHSDLSAESVSEHLQAFQFFILVPALLSFTAVVTAGLLQTKFLFKPSLCAPDPKRFSGEVFSRERFQGAASALLLFGVVTAVSILLFWTYAREYLALLNAAPGDIMNYLGSWNLYAALAAAVLLTLLAFFCWLLAHVNFMLRHKMSRFELLREGE